MSSYIIQWPVNQSKLRNCNIPWLGFNNSQFNLVPRACVFLYRRSENSTALGKSKTGTRNQNHCARAREMVMTRTTANQLRSTLWRAFRLAQRSQTRRIAASGDEIAVNCNMVDSQPASQPTRHVVPSWLYLSHNQQARVEKICVIKNAQRIAMFELPGCSR